MRGQYGRFRAVSILAGGAVRAIASMRALTEAAGAV